MHSYTTPPQTIQFPAMLPYINMPNGAALGTPGMSQMSDQTTHQQQPNNNTTDQSTFSRQPTNNLPPLADISQLKQGTAEYQFAAARNIYQTGYAAMLEIVKNKDISPTISGRGASGQIGSRNLLLFLFQDENHE